MTLLCEITDKEMIESNPTATKKCMEQLTENSVWVILLKVCVLADKERNKPGNEGLQGEANLLITKCLSLIENMLEWAPFLISNKIMHSDNVIDYLLSIIENEE